MKPQQLKPAVSKTIPNKIRHDYPLAYINILVSYAIFAKNCLVDNRGFTPHQRVDGPSNIPSILSDNVCNSNTEYASNEERTHLNLLNDTRQAYVSAESSDRIKRALKAHIFTSDTPFYNGEKVFYWKESQDKASRGWKGPATIICSEGKVIVIRHGSFIHRCHETKVRRTSEGSVLSKVNKTENTATPLVFLISCDTDSPGVTNQNQDTINTSLNRNMPAERKSTDDITVNNNTSLETERNIPIP